VRIDISCGNTAGEKLNEDLLSALPKYFELIADAIHPGNMNEAFADILDNTISVLSANGAALYANTGSETASEIFICRELSNNLCDELRRLGSADSFNANAREETVRTVDGGSLYSVLIRQKPVLCHLFVLYKKGPPGEAEKMAASSLAELFLSLLREQSHYRELEQRMYESVALASIGRTIVSTLDMERVLNQVVKMVAYIMNAAVCLIVLYDEEEGEPVVEAVFGMERLEERSGIVRHAINIYKRVEALHSSIDCNTAEKYLGRLCYMAVPLFSGERINGVIIVYREEAFFEHEKSLMQATAVQASIALENARLHSSLASFTERELCLAARIQQGLLPRSLPHTARYDFGSKIHFMREVGGDYYDIIPLGNERQGISIGDVSGKSVPAAILVAMAKYVLRASAVMENDPARSLEAVNRNIINDLSPEMFISMFYGILDFSDNKLVYANAGHEPPLLFIEHSHSCRFLHATGVVLGVMSNSSYQHAAVELKHGDWLVLYTDGITEARKSDGELFGSRRVCEAVERNHHISAQVMAEYLFKEVYDYSNGKISDDVAILAINRIE
jgi:serine phosphatase RsbU (regulator of sigma subunit)